MNIAKEQKNVDEIKGTTSGLTQMAVEGHEWNCHSFHLDKWRMPIFITKAVLELDLLLYHLSKAELHSLCNSQELQTERTKESSAEFGMCMSLTKAGEWASKAIYLNYCAQVLKFW